MNKINASKLWQIIQEAREYMGEESILPVSYTHLTLPTTPYV